MNSPRTLVLVGYGINCDYETAHAFETCGAVVDRVHVNDLISGKKNLEDYHVFFIPGGFSYGDELGAGKVLANKLILNLEEEILDFIEEGKLVGGHCNGAQVMAKMGLIPALQDYTTPQMTLTVNMTARYEDRWVHVKPVSRKCIWTKNLPIMRVPVAHGEGRFYTKDATVLDEIKRNDQVALVYVTPDGKPANGKFPHNPNGSIDDLAGICDPSGRVFAQMPHPERFCSLLNHPQWTRMVRSFLSEGHDLESINWDGKGLLLFKNAVSFVKEHLL